MTGNTAHPFQPGSAGWSRLWILIVVTGFAALCFLLFGGRGSADLSAIWLAGGQISAGRPDLVYPPDTAVFTMLPPPEWTETARAEGMQGDVFPYVYPPLWAALAAMLRPVTDLQAVLAAAAVLNPVMLALSLLMAHRIAAPRLSPPAWMAAGLVFMIVTSIGLIALGQNQPQILVSFLILLAIERSERRADIAAGIALALAAAIKGYPALIVLVWLMSGNCRAAVAFAAAGGALAALSVALAGWPLHGDFLRASRAIAGTGLLTNLSYNLDSVLGNTVLADRVAFILSPYRDPALGDRAGWFLYARPGWLVLLGLLLQIAALALTARALRGRVASGQRAAIWAAGLTFATLAGPVAWSYYYIAPAAFLPLLIDRLGWLRGLLAMTVLALPVSAPTAIWFRQVPFLEDRIELFGAAVAVAMGIAFLRLSRPRPAPG